MARPEITVTSTGAEAIHDALASLPRGGAIVRLPAGRFPLHRAIELAGSTTLAGAGPGRTVLVPDADLETAVASRGAQHLSLRALSIEWPEPPSEGPATTPASRDGAVSLREVRRLTLADVLIVRAPGAGVRLVGCTEVRASAVAVRTSGGTGIAAARCTDVELTGTVHGAGLGRATSGVHLDGLDGAALHVVVDGAGGTGVLVDATSGPVTDVVLHAEVAEALRGIVATAIGAHPVRDLTITGSCTGVGHVGVQLTNIDRATVADVTIEGRGPAGIVLDGRTGSRRCTIAGARVRGFATEVAEEGGSRDNRILAAPDVRRRASSAAAEAPSTPTTSAPTSTSPTRRAKRAATGAARRADRAARRLGRRTPAAIRRPVAKVRRTARATWRSRGAR
jgi:hypothetical protein